MYNEHAETTKDQRSKLTETKAYMCISPFASTPPMTTRDETGNGHLVVLITQIGTYNKTHMPCIHEDQCQQTRHT
jgi:hypothetical protein